MADEITVGDRRRIFITGITNEAGAVVDPPTLKLDVRDPAGVLVTYTYGVGTVIVRDALGAYHAYIPLPLKGRWKYDWEALDALSVSLYTQGGAFYVYPLRTAA